MALPLPVDINLIYELADKAGPLSPMAVSIAGIVALALIFNLVLRPGFWRFRALFDGGLSWLCVIGLTTAAAMLYVWNERQPVTFDLLGWIIAPLSIAMIGFVLLLGVSEHIREFGNVRVLAGSRRSADAQAIFEGRWADVSSAGQTWKPVSRQVPLSEESWFEAMAGQVSPQSYAEFIWPFATRRGRTIRMWLGQVLLMGGLTLALAVIAIEMIDVDRQDKFNVGHALIVFETNSAIPSAFEKPRMHALAYSIARQKPQCIRVIGHTDSRSSSIGNDVLSERRAAYVAGWLERQDGLGNVPMIIEGRADNTPLVPEAGLAGAALEEAQQSNRRVEIDILHTSADCPQSQALLPVVLDDADLHQDCSIPVGMLAWDQPQSGGHVATAIKVAPTTDRYNDGGSTFLSYAAYPSDPLSGLDTDDTGWAVNHDPAQSDRLHPPAQ